MLRLRNTLPLALTALLGAACSSDETQALDGGTPTPDTGEPATDPDAGPIDTGGIAVGMVVLSTTTIDVGAVVGGKHWAPAQLHTPVMLAPVPTA